MSYLRYIVERGSQANRLHCCCTSIRHHFNLVLPFSENMVDTRNDWGRHEGEGVWPEQNKAQLLSESVIEVGWGTPPRFFGPLMPGCLSFSSHRMKYLEIVFPTPTPKTKLHCWLRLASRAHTIPSTFGRYTLNNGK